MPQIKKLRRRVMLILGEIVIFFIGVGVGKIAEICVGMLESQCQTYDEYDDDEYDKVVEVVLQRPYEEPQVEIISNECEIRDMVCLGKEKVIELGPVVVIS